MCSHPSFPQENIVFLIRVKAVGDRVEFFVFLFYIPLLKLQLFRCNFFYNSSFFLGVVIISAIDVSVAKA